MTFKVWGPEVRLQSGNSINFHSMTMLPNGSYVVTWQGTNERDIYFQIVDGLNTLGRNDDLNPLSSGVMTVPPGRGGQQEISDVQVLKDGSFVITWTEGNTSSDTNIFSRKYSIAGEPTGDPIEVTPAGPDLDKDHPAMTASGEGWATVFRNGTGLQLIRYSGEGAPAAPITVTDTSATLPKIADMGASKYVVSYISGGKVMFRAINGSTPAAKSGEVSGGQFTDIVALRDGNGELNGQFAVLRDAGTSIEVSIYTPSLTEESGYAVLKTVSFTTNAQDTINPNASIVALKTGGFAIAYLTRSTNPDGTGDQGDVFVQTVDVDGDIVNRNTDGTPAPLKVNSRAVDDGNNNQWMPTIAEMADGRLAVTWRDQTTSPAHFGSTIVDARTKAVTVNGTDGADIYVGTEYGVDTLRGAGGDDRLFGGKGNDKLDGGAGNDSLDGGEGSDDMATYEFIENTAGTGVVASLDTELSKIHNIVNTGEAAGDTYRNIENLAGSQYADMLLGNAGANDLYGGNGNDVLYGGAGGDVLNGGDKIDTVTYAYSRAGVGVTVSLNATIGVTNTNEAKGDTYFSIEVLVGTAWGDVLYGYDKASTGERGNNDEIYGARGNDILIGGQGNDTLNGGQDNDTLNGGLGADNLVGHDGFDFASYANAAAVEDEVGLRVSLADIDDSTGEAEGDTYTDIEGLIGSIRNDTLIGSTGTNELRGGAGNDILSGDGINPTIAGLADTLEGGSGADTLYGGEGVGIIDFASYANATAGAGGVGITANLNLRKQTGAGDVAGDEYFGIEGLIGSAYHDTLIGDGKANTLRGMGGNDVLVGGAGADVLDGGAGIDTVSYAGASAGVKVDLVDPRNNLGDATGDSYISIENVIGSNFADTFVGNAAVNVFQGGAGDDIYYVSAGDVVIENGNSGFDKVITDGNYTLGANLQGLEGTGNGAIVLTGNALRNTIIGNAAGNWIDGGAGIDTMMGGGGDDIYVVDDARDVVEDYLGANTIITTVQLDPSNVRGLFANITLADGANFIVQGTSGNNVLKGNSAINTLKGNGGNDKLYGMSGNDKLYGGTGRDVFVFDTRTNKRTNVDKVYDFKSRDDSFHLDNAIFTKLGRGSEAGVRFKSDMFVEGTRAKDREDRIVYDKKTGSLYYDADGTGRTAQVKIATITNKTTLKFDDFFVI